MRSAQAATADRATESATGGAATEVTVPAEIRRIVLVGFMGAGKTTVGRLLAGELGWEFLDLDAHVEARAGATVPELFEQHGEDHFRQVESHALANALRRVHTVLALGGGTPEQVTNRLLLEQTPGTRVIYLHAPFVTLFDRCMLQGFADPSHVRPLLTTPEEAEARFARRHPVYSRLARHTVATDGATPELAAEAVLRLIRERK